MSTDKQALVTTKSGKLEGEHRDGLYVFKGIPYAEPPLGELRWMPPQPVKKWDGVRPAKEYGAMAPQLAMVAPSDSPGMPNFGDVPQSEDCLFLNIWTPGLDERKRPVMFWIHGGAFIIGAGSETFLDSGVLPKSGDIVAISRADLVGMHPLFVAKRDFKARVHASGSSHVPERLLLKLVIDFSHGFSFLHKRAP